MHLGPDDPRSFPALLLPTNLKLRIGTHTGFQTREARSQRSSSQWRVGRLPPRCRNLYEAYVLLAQGRNVTITLRHFDLSLCSHEIQNSRHRPGQRHRAYESALALSNVDEG